MSNYKKIGSIAVGTILFYIIINSLASMIQIISLTIQYFDSTGLWGTLVFSGIILILLLWVFKKRNAIANKLFKYESDIGIDKSITFPQAVNLVCIFAGLIVLSSAIPTLLMRIADFAPAYQITGENKKIDIRQFSFLAALILKLVIGLYLVCGAPHFVKWQIARIKKLTEETIE